MEARKLRSKRLGQITFGLAVLCCAIISLFLFWIQVDEESAIILEEKNISSTRDDDSGLTDIQYECIDHAVASEVCIHHNREGKACNGQVFVDSCRNGLEAIGLARKSLPGQARIFCSGNSDFALAQIRSKLVKTNEIIVVKDTMVIPKNYFDVFVLDLARTTHDVDVWHSIETAKRHLRPGGILAISRLSDSEYNQTLFGRMARTGNESLTDYTMPNNRGCFLFQKPRDAHSEKAPLWLAQEQKFLREEHQPTSNRSTGNQVQISHASGENRYPALYSAAADYFFNNTTKLGSQLKILSFGSSYGFEAKTLADRYFTGKADIYGVDLDDEVLSQARKNAANVKTNNITFFNGATTPGAKYGPFNAIFANSVLCIHIPNKMHKPLETIRSRLPFQTFQNLVEEIDALLSVGSLLLISNTNYRFIDTSVSAKYRIWDVKPVCRQLVFLLDPEQKKLLYDSQLPYEERVASQYSMQHCMFIKER